MKDPTSKSVAKGIEKQPDLRQFILENKKFQGTSCSSPREIEAPSNDCEPRLSQSFNSPQTEDCSVPWEEEDLLYDVELLLHDPGKRISIMQYPPKQRNAVRQAYILKKPCQPKTYDFPQRELGGMRRFSSYWLNKYDWLEYSIEKDAAFCFVCYLFKDEVEMGVGEDAFVNEGFRSWNKPDRFEKHVGGIKSAHNLAYEKYVNLRDSRNKSISYVFYNAKETIQSGCETQLKASLTCLRFLLGQGLVCRGHNESEDLISKENFLELLKLLGKDNKDVDRVTLKNVPGNTEMMSPMIQKDLINCCAKETTKRIIEGLGDDYFGIFADVSSDVSHKEQLALCLRYVDSNTGMVVERFLGLVHMGDTSALSLKSAIMSLLMEHSLNPSKIRGQWCGGASNMKGEINSLKTLIMKDTPCAYYVHCFAHQLHLTLVGVAKENNDCCWFFETLANLLNVVGVSCKRREMIRVSQAQKVAEALEIGEFEGGSGLDQELDLKSPEDTHWGSHYKSLLNVIHLFPTIIEVLVMIGNNGSCSEDGLKAQGILYSLESFDFVFMAHLMWTIFGYTNDLSLALLRKDQHIVNAMTLVSSAKHLLQKTRDCGWEPLLDKVISFCTKYDIVVPDMDAPYILRGRSRRFVQEETNLQHYRVQNFLEILDSQLNELNDRFNEVNMELLTCMACLSPKGGFSSFDKEKVLKLATFYQSEFSSIDLMTLEFQLDIFIEDMQSDDRFKNLNDLGALSMKLVETRKHLSYPNIYLLIKLVLVLPVATAGVERLNSGMTYIRHRLWNNKGDQLLNDCLVTFIEKDVFLQISDDVIADRFQKMKTRRV